MSNLLKYRGIVVLSLVVFSLSVYWSITLSRDKAVPVAVNLGPTPEVIAKPNSKINNVLEFRISDKLKINSASVEDIYSRLKGIGPKTAQAIVDYRNQYGPFESPEDLLAVKGIGPATIRDIEQQISYSLKAMKDIQQ